MRLLTLAFPLLLSAAVARAGESKEAAPRSLTVGPDPFRRGSEVVRDGTTGQPIYRIDPDPFHPDQRRIENYDTGKPIGEIRPDPFKRDQSVIDLR